MREQATPTLPAGLVTETPGPVATASGWSLISQLFADRWNEWPTAGAQLWRSAQLDTHAPLGLRIRAATAADVFR